MINLTAIPKPPVCKYCKLVIFIGRGTLADQRAQEDGFTDAICRSLFRDEMEYAIERMESNR